MPRIWALGFELYKLKNHHILIFFLTLSKPPFKATHPPNNGLSMVQRNQNITSQVTPWPFSKPTRFELRKPYLLGYSFFSRSPIHLCLPIGFEGQSFLTRGGWCKSLKEPKFGGPKQSRESKLVIRTNQICISSRRGSCQINSSSISVFESLIT